MQRLVEERNGRSLEFAVSWNEGEVGRHGEGVEGLRHPVVGPLTLRYSTPIVDGRPNLGLMIFTPATAADGGRVRRLVTRFGAEAC